MKSDELYALQISPHHYEAYQLRQHTIPALIVADKLYDQTFMHWWIRDWLEEPTTPLEQLPLCVENELRLAPKWYIAHIKYCVNHNLLDILRTTWISEAVPKDIMNAVRMQNIQMSTINFLLNEGFPPTEKIFLHALMDSHIPLLQSCFGHGWDMNHRLGEYTPLEWCAAFATEDAVDTCILYGAKVTDRAITNALQQKDNFLRLCEEDSTELKDEHLRALVDRALHAYDTTRTVPEDIIRMFEEMYARRVPAGSHYTYISRVRDMIRYPPLKATLSLFC